MGILARLARNINQQPERPALRFLDAPTHSLTYGELGLRLSRATAFLQDLGLNAGDRLALQLPKGLAFILLHWSALRLGVISLPLNPTYPSAELEYYLRDSGARFLFQSDDMPTIATHLPKLEGILTIDAENFPDTTWSVSPPPWFVFPEPNAAQPATMIYTSGTTGRPKGALLTHGNLAANAIALHKAWDWRCEDVLLHTLPLFHVHGLFVALQGALYAGAETRLLRRFRAGDTLAALRSGEYSVFMAVPTIHARLLEHPAQCDLRGMRLVTSGSDRLPDDLFERFEAKFGYRLLERYGMTETGMNLANPLCGERRRGSVGRPLPGVEARIVDREGTSPLGVGEVGELQIRGPHVFAGYWRRPKQTADAFVAEGWLRTGDLAARSKDGYYTLYGRASDLIISGGLNIYPPEVERVLSEHSALLAVAVLGLPDPRWGERVLALVVPREDTALEDSATLAKLEEELRGHCRKQLAPYKCPSEFRFVAVLPRNAMGKVQKQRLREQFLTDGRDAAGKAHPAN